jgi:hypothetical protein
VGAEGAWQPASACSNDGPICLWRDGCCFLTTPRVRCCRFHRAGSQCPFAGCGLGRWQLGGLDAVLEAVWPGPAHTCMGSTCVASACRERPPPAMGATGHRLAMWWRGRRGTARCRGRRPQRARAAADTVSCCVASTSRSSSTTTTISCTSAGCRFTYVVTLLRVPWHYLRAGLRPENDELFRFFRHG